MIARPVSFKIHPPIGIARVGNAPAAFLIDPDGRASETYKDTGDADNLFLPRIKRHAARFRLFGYDAAGHCTGEVAPDSVQSIRWSVCLANTKASGTRIEAQPGDEHGRTRPRQRNKHVPSGERWRLEITPQPRHLTGPNQRAMFDDGHFMGIQVCLGEARTDSAGHLLVLGGFGKAGTCDAGKRIRGCTDNDGWYDDVSDGPVTAELTLHDGTIVSAAPGWVIVTPPNFTPGMPAIATMYDVLLDRAIAGGLLQVSTRLSFADDIAPLLRRIAARCWIDKETLRELGVEGIDIDAHWGALADSTAKTSSMRERVLAKIMHDPTAAARLTVTQRTNLTLWAAGSFDPVPRPAAEQPAGIDRAALDRCDGSVLPRELDLLLAGDAFRFDPRKLAPGMITRGMAYPWQADLVQAASPSIPSLPPREVLTPEALHATRALDEQIATAAEEERMRLLRDRRAAAWATRATWARGLPSDSPAREESLVKEWQHLGFVLDHGESGAPCFVETERSPWLGTMADYFHWLVNVETNRGFAAKALELALGMLEDAKFSADQKFTPFRYSPEAFDRHLDAIYADFVDTVMYKPVSWESGDITWNAIVDYDEADEPVRAERRFRVGRFSDAALKERFRQFGPLNLTDGAWLQNILPAGPADEVRARLFTIWLDEAGNGRPELNHSNVYETLLRSLNVYMPPVTSRAFVEQDLVRSAFESSVFQLCVGLFTHRFLPELLGMTLFVEWEATPTMDPIGRMMTARHIDPQYYRMHAAIDNVNAGHGALARDAIKAYLHAKEQEGGDIAVQEHWQRIWRGYVAWSTLGNGADEVLERMMLVDKKQIRLGSSLLLASEIQPPLVASLQAGEDSVSVYLRGRLAPATAALLDAWTEGVPSAELLEALRRDLNACLRTGIYDAARFAAVSLSTETRGLLRVKSQQAVDLIDLGRSLLEDTYPAGIARRPGFPDVKAHYAARMAALIRHKTPLALQSHRRRGWLIEAFATGPEAVMEALLRRGLIDIDHPARSALFEKLEFSGPMYKVFTDEERAVIIDWIESLRADGAAVTRPQAHAFPIPEQVTALVAPLDTEDKAGNADANAERSYGEKRARIGMGAVH